MTGTERMSRWLAACLAAASVLAIAAGVYFAAQNANPIGLSAAVAMVLGAIVVLCLSVAEIVG